MNLDMKTEADNNTLANGTEGEEASEYENYEAGQSHLYAATSASSSFLFRTVGPCYECNKMGHIAKDCWYSAANQGRGRGRGCLLYTSRLNRMKTEKLEKEQTVQLADGREHIVKRMVRKASVRWEGWSGLDVYKRQENVPSTVVHRQSQELLPVPVRGENQMFSNFKPHELDWSSAGLCRP